MEKLPNSRCIHLLRNACIAPCIVLLALTACSRAIRQGMDAASQTKPAATVQSTLINPIPKKPDWFVFLQRASATLVQHTTQATLPDAYKLHYMAYMGDDTQLTEYMETHPKWINKSMNGNVTPLHLAVFQGNVECTRLLLDEGANIRALMDETNAFIQPIHIAAHGNALEVLRALISAQCTVVADCDATGKTALHWAAQKGHTAVAEALLKAPGIDTNAKDKRAYTPLHWAAQKGHAAVAEVLLKAPGIDIHAKDQLGYTPLHWAAANEHTGVAEALLKSPGIDTKAKDKW